MHGFEQLNVSRVILAAGNLTSPWAWVMRSVTTLLHPRYARNEQILVRKVARNAGALAVGQNVPSAQTQGFGARAGVRVDACVMYNPDWAP